MSMPDRLPGAPVTLQKDYSPTPENIARRLTPFITSPDQLPPVEREALSGKVAVITGSTRGIGAATARIFAEYGMKVVVNGREESDRGNKLVTHIQERGGEALFVPADVSTPEGAKTLIGSAKEKYGSVDVVVNNAGTKEDDLMIRLTPSQWHTVMRTNLDSAYFVTTAAIDAMAKNKPRGGMIISVSSVGQEGFPGQVSYAASKRGMEAIADVTAQEYARRDIKTSILRVGLTETDLTSDMTAAQKQALIDMLPAHREFQAEEVARTMPFLATLKESGHILTLA